MPPPKVPSVTQVAGKWNRRTSTAGTEYETGVRNPSVPWAQAAAAGKANYAAGVTAAIQRDGYAKGVTQAGDTRWQTKTIEKGPPRFAQGVAVSEADFAAGVAPVLEAISRVDLPPRGPRGAPQNLQRVAPIASALAALKRR
jgi:hypothetical protein